MICNFFFVYTLPISRFVLVDVKGVQKLYVTLSLSGNAACMGIIFYVYIIYCMRSIYNATTDLKYELHIYMHVFYVYVHIHAFVDIQQLW